jgi:undecaprenyl pyrophosphate synthase
MARQGWYMNWRNFTPTHGMRLIADYRSRQETCT